MNPNQLVNKKGEGVFESEKVRVEKEKMGKINEGFEMIEKENENSTVGFSEVSKENVAEVKSSKCKKPYVYWGDLRRKFICCLNRPRVIHWVSLGLIGLAFWCIIYSIAGSGFVPGSQLFSLIILFIFAYIGGAIFSLIKLPSLLGMLLLGLLLRNVGFIHLKSVYIEISAALREIALCIILIRAGLGLDPGALKSLRVVILRLACIPGIVEGIITMTVTHFLLELPWLWGMLLGGILAAVSPAVVIPCLFSLQERGYGTEKGIPTLVVAAASLDDLLAITVFGVFLNVIFSTDTDITMQIVQGFLGILGGISFGVLWGFIAHFVPHQRDGQVVLMRVLMSIAGGLMATIGSKAIGYQGAGPVGCLTIAFVASLGWRKQGYDDGHFRLQQFPMFMFSALPHLLKNPVADVFRVIWSVFQPILFGLIGSEVDVSVLEISTVGNGLLALFCSLLGRFVVTIFIAFGAKFNWKEKTFIALAWFPKATVQAALGPLALDIARRNNSKTDIIYGSKILILAVLAILITAPIGATLITILGPKLLSKDNEKPVRDQTKIDEVSLESKDREKNST